ncbi:hypothetical protein GOV14_00875 [Candidatus Pacearchaeota archaeon]|nr:hypothetical protein [Candidatus Pacearchaeota archaeon]
MFTKKEVTWLIIAIILLGFIIEFSDRPNNTKFSGPLSFFQQHPGFIYAIIIIIIPVTIKNLVASRYSIKIEHKILHFRRWGWYRRSQLKKPFPIGLIVPFFVALITLGYVKLLGLIQFDAQDLPKKRVLRKRGRVRKIEMNESDTGYTALWGFWSLIFISIISLIFKYPDLAKYSIYYASWNLLPIGNLDGMKLFFGSVINWIILAIICFPVGLTLFIASIF